jgi:hypothetical protein
MGPFYFCGLIDLSMRSTEFNDRDASPTRTPDLHGDGLRLRLLLNLLVTTLQRIRADDPVPDVRSGAAPERWGDEEFVYLESNLPGVPGSEIDISIHEGLVFIRIER